MEFNQMPDSGIFVPGTQVMFEVPRSLETKGQTFFRGCKEDHYIILDYPNNANGVPLALKDQMPCIVRFLFQGKVYAFETEIIRTVRYPYPFVFIHYPQELDYINLRNSERYPIRIPAVFSEQAIEGSVEGNPEGRMLDLSERGCLLEAKRLFDLDTLLFLAFNLPNEEMIMNLAAKVRRISRKEETYYLGLQFLVSEDPDIEKIRRYLAYLEALQIQA
jgi:c-di-GMP-binding flagellar brake protein YcgR